MKRPSVRYCKKCTLISSSAVPIDFDMTGVCTACQTSDEAQIIDWERRELLFQDLVSEYRDPTVPYDCIIPVSGGKDSYWQIHKAKEYGLRPLLVQPSNFSFAQHPAKAILELSFGLPPGAYATVMLQRCFEVKDQSR